MKKSSKHCMIQVRMTESERKWLKIHAAREGTSMSAVILDLLAKLRARDGVRVLTLNELEDRL